jgi:hypothetical protein
MTKPSCPVHHIPLALGERIDSRRDVDPREWSCPEGKPNGHWMSPWTVEHANNVACQIHDVPMHLVERQDDRQTLTATQVSWYCSTPIQRESATGHWYTQPQVEKRDES